MLKIINSNEQRIVVQAYAGCFQSDTKYYNGKEWKFIKDYVEDDYVLQYNPLELKGELVKPIKYIKRKNDSGWYNIKLGGGSKIICSGSHIVLLYDREYNIFNVEARELKEFMLKNNSEYYVLCPTNSYVGQVNTVFKKILNVELSESNEELEYCFTVPSEHLIIKQNHTIFTTHNCGKSTTMLEYVKANPNESILFIVFNKSMADEFKDKLKGIRHNCTVSTIHALAYRWYLSQGYSKKALKNVSIIDIKNILNSKLEYEQLSKIMMYFNMYLASNVNEPKDLKPIHPEDRVYFKHVARLWEYFRVYSDFMPHNVYLKMYQLAKVKLHYSTIIADELNDCSEVMLDLLVTNMDKKIIAVGDSHQAIMSFSFCVDGLKVLKDEYGFVEYPLTNSFRVSESVANLSSRYLTYMKDTDVSFHGLSKTKFGKLNLLEADSKTKQIHLLCRTKLGGLKEISELLDKDDSKKIFYVGGLEGFGIKEIERVLAYRGTVYIGGEKFHINQLRAMLKKGVEDAEISRICSIYGFVEKNEDMIEVLKQTEVKKKEQADIIVLTSHVSKGLTLENTLLGRDFPPIQDTKNIIGKTKDKHSYIRSMAQSEANLMYVAMTRATGILDIGNALNKNDVLKDGDKIQGDIESAVYLKIED